VGRIDIKSGDAPALSDSRILQKVHQLYRSGLYRQAHAASEPLGPLSTWRGAEGRVMAGRLAGVLGSFRLCILLHKLAHREHPSDELACYYAARSKLYTHGPWAAWKMIQQGTWSAQSDSALRADVSAFRGYLLALFRDFQQARVAFAEAFRIAPQRAWIHTEHASALVLEDRYEEALLATDRSLEIQPWNRPAVQGKAYYFRTMGRNDEARELLVQATQRLECGETWLQLAELYHIAGDYAEALRATDRGAELLLLADKFTRQRLDSTRSDLAYHSGDEPLALQLAERLTDGFHERLVKNLRAATPTDRRVVLDVPFVRQHHLTCAPATLAALSQYWNRPAEHLQIAEAICYDGTPAHSERRWAEQSGYLPREFTVDWPTTVALIDRGIPFTFTTVEATTAHLQAVVGYDARRRTLLLREPSTPRLSELLADEGLAYYRGIGPRGMAIVPRDQSGRLADLELPDAALYDEFFLLQQALEKHDRPAAQASYLRMAESSADNPLTFNARRTIAYYDSDYSAALRSLDQSLQGTPDSPPLLFAKLNLMRTEVTRAERLPFLEGLGHRRDLDPIFRLHWAEELSEDARQHPLVIRLLRRLLRQRPVEGRIYYALANIAWAGGDFAEGTSLYRIAACLDDRREGPSRQYFLASRYVHQTSVALEWLKDRMAHFGDKSSLPAQTLFWAYESLEQTDDAFKVLSEAGQQHPDDDTLPLFAVEAYARYGKQQAATDALARCRQRVHESAWLRAKAKLSSARGDLPDALAAWQEVVAREPQSAAAVDAVARLLEQIDGREAARAYWQGVLERFPYNVALLRAAVSWLRNNDPPCAEQNLNRLLDLHPNEPWALRERAIVRLELLRLDDALSDVDLAISIDPRESYGYSLRGGILSRKVRLSEAAINFRRALELNVDNENAIQGWLADCRSLAERTTALAFFYEQLVKQTSFGDGLIAYADLARPVLPGEVVLTNLRAGLAERPDLWHAWSAVIQQLLALERWDEASVLARQMAARFPLLPVAWSEVAATCQMRGDTPGEIAALQSALEINCQWTHAIGRLADAYMRQNDLAKARTVIEQALRRTPHVAILHGYDADLRWRAGDREGVLAALRRAVEEDPNYTWAWQTLQQWAAQFERPDLPATIARALVDARPHESRAWYWLARSLYASADFEDRLAAARRVIELDPHWLESHVLYSRLLAEAGRFDEALAACHGAGEAGRAPRELRAQEADVLRRQGKNEAAFDLLSTLLAENRDFVAGWHQLATWGAQEPKLQAARLEAARELVRLQPTEPEAWRQLGEATSTTDVEASKAAWTRVLQLAPTYRYAAVWLFDLQFEDMQYEQAAQTLQAIEERAPDIYVWSRRVQLATSRWRPDKGAATAALAKLCTASDDDSRPLAAAIEFMIKRRWHRLAKKVLANHVNDPQSNPFVLGEYISILQRGNGWMRAKRVLANYQGSSLAWNLAAERLMSTWATRKAYGLPRFVRRNVRRLQADTNLWGTVGYALQSCGHWKAAQWWLGDFRERKGVQPWMLYNLALSLRRSGLRDDAIAVHKHALRLPADHVTSKHALWLAVESAIQGDDQQCRNLLESVETDAMATDLPMFAKALRSMARGVLIQRERIGSVKHWLDCWRIEGAFRREVHPYGESVKKDRLLKKLYVECLRTLLREAGYPITAWWMPLMIPI